MTEKEPGMTMTNVILKALALSITSDHNVGIRCGLSTIHMTHDRFPSNTTPDAWRYPTNKHPQRYLDIACIGIRGQTITLTTKHIIGRTGRPQGRPIMGILGSFGYDLCDPKWVEEITGKLGDHITKKEWQ
jgi:hypothetical protein